MKEIWWPFLCTNTTDEQKSHKIFTEMHIHYAGVVCSRRGFITLTMALPRDTFPKDNIRLINSSFLIFFNQCIISNNRTITFLISIQMGSFSESQLQSLNLLKAAANLSWYENSPLSKQIIGLRSTVAFQYKKKRSDKVRKKEHNSGKNTDLVVTSNFCVRIFL